jgi:hypothetical protein
VEHALNVTFDCSIGLVPGRCICPPSEPELSAILVFDAGGPQAARLQALFTSSHAAHTARGISVGSSKPAVEHAYPGASLNVNAPLTSGLSTYLLAHRHGHALVFTLIHGRVSSIMGFARGGRKSISSEQCG